MEVANKMFIFPNEKSLIISFCSFWLNPVSLFFNCPTKTFAVISGISFKVLHIFVTVSLWTEDSLAAENYYLSFLLSYQEIPNLLITSVS